MEKKKTHRWKIITLRIFIMYLTLANKYHRCITKLPVIRERYCTWRNQFSNTNNHAFYINFLSLPATWFNNNIFLLLKHVLHIYLLQNYFLYNLTLLKLRSTNEIKTFCTKEKGFTWNITLNNKYEWLFKL